MLAGGNANLAVASAAACTAPDGVICATTRGRYRLTDTRFCRIEDVVVAHIYPYIGILTHDLPALRESAVEYFPSFWQEIISPSMDSYCISRHM